MARALRPAVRCSARAKTTGRQCRCFAMLGATTCRMHGAAARQVRQAAFKRLTLDRVQRQVDMHQKRLRRWNITRLIAAAEVLGLDPMELAKSPMRPLTIEYAARVAPSRVAPLSKKPKTPWEAHLAREAAESSRTASA